MQKLQLPTLNLSLLYTGSIGVAAVAKQIRESFRTFGFAYVTNHGISEHLVRQMFQAAKEFHDLPFQAKHNIKQNEFFRGYVGSKASQVKNSTQGHQKKPNLSEAFVMMHEVPESHTSEPFTGPNQWPEEMPHLKNLMTAYSEAMTQLALLIVQAFSLAFDLEQHALDDLFVAPTFFLRLHRYPAQAEESVKAEEYGVAPHTDIGFMTFVSQDNVGGLQVKHPETGEWIDVPYIANTFVLNAGDMLNRLTNGTYPSAIHRVLNTSLTPRYSIPFFFDPNLNKEIAPLKTFTQDKEILFPPVVYGDYATSRVKPNYTALQ
jgi:isopenicillin N synthase-like dioxygenase